MLGIVLAIGSLFVLGVSPTTESQAFPTIQEQNAEPVMYNDYTLQIPSIGLTTQMEKIVRQGTSLPVPDNNPGYYSANNYNLFIVGHNHTIFKRLNEKPKAIIIWQNGEQKTYNLVAYENKPKEQISMERLLDFHGIVIMTCSGEYIDGGFTHRLLLYYQ